LRRGELDDVRLLPPRTVDLMARNRLPGDLESFGRPLFAETSYAGVGFGLGFSATVDPVAAASTAFGVDPVDDLAARFLTQFRPASTYPIRPHLPSPGPLTFVCCSPACNASASRATMTVPRRSRSGRGCVQVGKRSALTWIIGWRVWTYFRRRPWTFALGVALLLLESFAPRNASYVVLVAVTVIITVKGLVELLHPAYEDVKRTVEIKPRKRPDGPLLHGYVPPYDGWRKISFRGDEAIHDPELDAALARDTVIRFDADPTRWLPTGDYEHVRALKVSTLDFDEDKVRLSSDLVAGVQDVRVRRTLYSAFLVTNRLAAYEYRKPHSQRELLPFDDIGLDADGRVPKLTRSRCSNHVGVDVLAVSDGRILLQRQSLRNRLNGGLVIGSGSGSADWHDLLAPCVEGDLTRFVRHSMRREMCEELGLTRAETPTLEDIRIVGYSRMTSLGGKPQFYGVARLPAGVEPRVHGAEALYVEDHEFEDFDPDDGVDGFRAALERVERKYRNEMAFPLYATIQLIKQWLAADPTADRWLRATASTGR
jgi:8-oxo-dGTP pyrophosphatase MutT (NUDIX family)